MLKKKFDEFLEIMELFLSQQGYQRSRKKGEYHKIVSGKIIKIRMVLSSVRNGGNLGEIRVFAAFEYPEVEKIVSMLKEVPYKKGDNLFYEDIALLRGERLYYSLNFSCDSNMEHTGAAMKAELLKYVFPFMCDYEDDEKILDDFESSDTTWRRKYFSGGQADIHFYLRWIALCVLCGYLREALVILENIPAFYGWSNEIQPMKDRLKTLCSEREQASSFYLLFDNKIKINPGKEEIERGLFSLDGLKKYFLILEESKQGNYLQIAGGSGEYTVEIRTYNSQGYEHCRAETKSEDKSLEVNFQIPIGAITRAQPALCGKEESLEVNFQIPIGAITRAQPALCGKEENVRKIFYGGSYLNLQTCQVLSIDQAREIVGKYLMDRGMHENYNWVELAI